MNLARLNMRRLATAAAAAAVLVPAIALAASASPAAANHSAAAANHSAAGRSHALSARCRSGFLTDWIGLPGDAKAGSTWYMVEISNTSSKTCTLYGFPGVLATGSNGRQLGSPAARAHGWTELPLTLRPHDTVHFVLGIIDTVNYPAASCHPAIAYGLRVYAPGAYSSKTIPFRFAACSRRGPAFLQVSPTIGGTGVPGFGN
jgi:uncharacterized membrane protein